MNELPPSDEETYSVLITPEGLRRIQQGMPVIDDSPPDPTPGCDCRFCVAERQVH